MLKINKIDINAIDSEGCTPLFYSIEAKNEKLLRILLKHGANPNVLINRQGDSLLHFVLQNNYKKIIVELLLKFGALADIRNAKGETPFDILIKKMPINSIRNFPLNLQDEDETCRLRILDLLKNQQSYQRGLEADAIHSSIRLSSWSRKIPKISGEEGYDLDLYDEYGEIPQCIALGWRFGDGDSLTLLLLLLEKYNFNINLRNYYGTQESPLHLAAQRGSLDLASLLVKHGANTSISNAEKTTPLHYAVGFGNIPLTRFFLENGANVHARDCFGLTPILVTSHYQIKLIELLLQKGADPNDRGELTIFENNEFMLESAELKTNDLVSILKTRKLLLKYGAYPIVRMTPLNYFTICANLHLFCKKYNSKTTTALTELKNTYNNKRGASRLKTYLSCRYPPKECSQIETLKQSIVFQKIEQKKKFIYVIGSQENQINVVNLMARIIKANVNKMNVKNFLHLMPGFETVIADLETESLSRLVRNEEIFEKTGSGIEKEFIKDFELTQQLLRQLLLDSTGLDQSLSTEDLLSCISLKILPKPLKGHYKLKSFFEERIRFCTSLHLSSTSHQAKLTQYFYFNEDKLSYFRYNAKMRCLILEKLSYLSQLSYLEDHFSKDEFSREDLVEISHIWRPYGNQSKIFLWEADSISCRLTSRELFPDDNDALHFLKITANNSPEYYIPLERVEYNYHSQDISYLLSIRQKNFEDNINKFILPPVNSATGIIDLVNNINRLKDENKFNSTEIVFPYYHRGHWVTIWCAILDNGDLSITYVDWIQEKKEFSQHIRETIIKDSLQPLKRVLKQAYSIIEKPKNVMKQKKGKEGAKGNIKVEKVIQHPLDTAPQSDVHLNIVLMHSEEKDYGASGVLVVENIVDIITGRTSNYPILYDYIKIQELRICNYRQLSEMGFIHQGLTQ